MNVHEAITAHSRKQHAHLEQFRLLDEERERAIDDAVSRCAAGQPFTAEVINHITKRINDHALNGISPTRSFVTKEMIAEYVAQKAKR